MPWLRRWFASFKSLTAALLTFAIACQVALMLSLVLWNYLDARLEAQSFWLAMTFRRSAATNIETLPIELTTLLGCVLWLAVALVVISASAMLWAGQRFRSLLYAALICTLIAGWLSIYSQWRHIAWQGHRMRATQIIKLLRPIATDLNNEWPHEDGIRDGVGPFMAYPNGKPRTLILLTPLPVGNQFGSLAAIDRGNNGELRFELSRGMDSLWLEWSPSETTLSSEFNNGVGANYYRKESVPVVEGWTVSRFE